MRKLTPEQKIIAQAKKKESSKAFYQRNRERLIAYASDYTPQWLKSHPEARRAIQARWRIKLRHVVITHYGGKCACCRLADERFLSIDHINNDGAEHRRQNRIQGEGHHMYLWLKQHGYPTNVQVLCYNCNLAKQFNGGVCPHQIKPSD